MNLFIIESPFQMLSAIEAKEQLQLKDTFLIINLSKDTKNNQQILNLLALSPWDKVLKVPVYLSARITTFQYIFLLLFSSLRNISFSNFFMGEVRSDIFWMIANNIDTKELWILDDGAGTTSIQERVFIDLEKTNRERDKKKDIFIKMSFLKIPTRKLANIFSMYSIPPLSNQKVIENQFKFVKGKRKNISEDAETVYFIGSNLVKANVLSETEYTNMLSKVFNYYQKQEKNIKYILHRRENRNIIEQNFSTISIVEFDNIIELELLLREIQPMHIASFYSAALFSLQKIYNIKVVDSFRIDMNKVNKAYKKAINTCYDFNQEYMNIIDLGDI